MGERTGIEWTDHTWNPWHGCHKVSPGCKNCYMFNEKKRYGQDPNIVVRSKTKFREPLKWTDPALVFTCSWSDWFIEEADAWRDEAYDIIRQTPHLTYQILTKRIDRAAGRLPDPILPNLWLGVSVEDQPRADERIVELLRTPAAVRFLSLEPLLGAVDIRTYIGLHEENGEQEFREEHGWGYNTWSGGFTGPNTHHDSVYAPEPGIHWVIVGGESGPGARPMRADWARSIRDQCLAADVPFFFKQWGEYLPVDQDGAVIDGGQVLNCSDAPDRVGKRAAGRRLDGREWNEMPEVAAL